MTAANDSADWSNSIVDFDPAVDPAKLTAHPLNARTHPESQRRALRESLDRVGWVDVVKVNTETGRIVDGHARVEEAVRSGGTVPVLWVSLSAEQENYVLATFDPISAMAHYDGRMLEELLGSVDLNDESIGAMLTDLVAMNSTVPDPIPLDDLDDEHDSQLFWPVIKVQVDPVVHAAWNMLVKQFDGDPAAAFTSLIQF